ncbi:MAG: type IX secretion system sortase PorU [Paludibacter sp.]|nr:type IX secretion system sortase PorU [Paludibacter sp.]
MNKHIKNKVAILITFLFISSFLFAQTVVESTILLKWNNVQSWKSPSTIKKVISFDDAKYPDENFLPYYVKKIQSEQGYSYETLIDNAIYQTITNADELQLLAEVDLKSDILVINDLLSENKTNYANFSILPFVKRNNEYLKLISFELKINKVPAAKKMQSATLHSFASNSVLAQGKFIKTRIINSGIYKLTFEDLNTMGLSPANVRIFGYGGAMLNQSFLAAKIDDLPEVSIYMNRGADGIFNAGDYILFYAQGINRWAYDASRAMFTHTINPYSSFGYYFVTSDAGTGKKIESKATTINTSAGVFPITEFTDYQVYEKEITNLTNSGKEFYGESFTESSSINLTFNSPNTVLNNSTKVRLDVAASSSLASSFNLNLDGSQLKTLTVAKRTDGDLYEKAKAANGLYTFTPTKDALVFNLAYNKTTNTSVGYLNYLEVNTRRLLKMSGNAMQFQNIDYMGYNANNKYSLTDAGDNVQIWDITDPQNIFRIITEKIDGKLTFTDNGNEVKVYLAIDPTVTTYPKPEVVGNVANQNLHAIQPVDYVIITHPDFVTQAEKLAQAHRDINKLTVAIATTEQVYNEFSSGTPDATAYRWFLKMLYERANATNNTVDNPKYLLLFGRGSFDNRKLMQDSGDNLVLTYQAENSLVQTLSYVTDDYFAFLDDNEGTHVPAHLLDIGVGRFPVKTKEEASDVVNKTIGYMNNTRKGIWKNQLCYLGDDGDGALHMRQADSIASSLSRLYPSYQLNKIYLDAYQQEISASGESYPVARNQFFNLLRSGLFLLNFTGHAGASGWTNENILSTSDVNQLSNLNLPLWVAATCDFLQFDKKTVSAGEYVVLNPVGGGIGILSAARPVYASQNMTINKFVSENLFKNKKGTHYGIGEVIAKAKNSIGTEINKLSYVYMGDPAVQLNYPTNYKIITSKINQSTTFGRDTLKSMSIGKVQGFIADENGNKVTGFNGILHGVVYDKIQRITTLNNHNDGTLTYSDRPNKLFSGKTVIKNSEFSLTFMLPKDIKYNYGGGRINFYANDTINSDEAQGIFENFVIGGTGNTFVNETDGPQINMYLNSPNFVSGGKVNEKPLFVANVSDINGINMVGSGIGHDILVTIDDDPNKSYILNDYYESVINDYTKGTIRYKLPEIAEGKHILKFRVWDLLNNSSSQTIEFEVIKGLQPEIFSVSNYPNPAKTKTKIVVNHDRPETILNTTIDIFDLSGRKIWSISQATAENIEWNLNTYQGTKVKSGIYLYRVTIKFNESETYSKINKMLVIE